jgi:hypothetical protein
VAAEGAVTASADAERLAALRMLAAAYRADRLIELAADLADCIVAYGTGRVGPSPVRHAALLVVQETQALVLATVGEEEDDGD